MNNVATGLNVRNIRQIERWFERAQIDYTHHYMAMYAAFNSWYRVVTDTNNDREALNKLRKGNEIWDAYCAGESMRSLRLPMKHLAELTQREPLSYMTPHWRGEVAHVHDWCSLLEYWYRVRCLVMHGDEISSVYVYLAYETLSIFMQEILARAHGP